MPEVKGNVEAYQEITGNYLYHLTRRAPSHDRWLIRVAYKFRNWFVDELYSWRNWLTGEYYTGKHAPFILWSILGVKKSKHANFIALIDCISKLDTDANEIIIEIQLAINGDSLSEALFNYFKRLQNNTAIKDDAYYTAMSALKHAIHHFVEELGVEERIKKVKDTNGSNKHYIYEIPDEVNITINNRRKPNKINERAKIIKDRTKKIKDRIKKIKVRTKKNKDRAWKARANKFTTGIALGNIAPEILIVLGGFLFLSVFAWLLIPIKVFALIGAAYLGFKFAKKDLYEFCKQYYYGRLFQIKDPTTGEYKDLEPRQRNVLKFLSFFCIVAGLCNAALTVSSTLIVFGASPIVFSVATILGMFVLCLWTPAFFETMRDFASTIPLDLSECSERLNRRPGENNFNYKCRVTFESIKFVIALSIACATMFVVGKVGFYLFANKCTDMLKSISNGLLTLFPKVWSGLTAALPFIRSELIASIVSFLYSIIKFVFGAKKIVHLLDVFADVVQKKIFTSKNESQQKLNLIQEENKTTALTYVFVMGCLVSSRALITAGLYRHEAFSDHLAVPPIPSRYVPFVVHNTVLTFISTIYGKPTADSLKTSILPPSSHNRSLR